jgi:hypothetical protein
MYMQRNESVMWRGTVAEKGTCREMGVSSSPHGYYIDFFAWDLVHEGNCCRERYMQRNGNAMYRGIVVEKCSCGEMGVSCRGEVLRRKVHVEK